MIPEILKNDLEELLNIINEQYGIISRYEGKIPQIELDIIMSNIRRLYDDFYKLSRQNQQYGTESDKATPLEPVKEKILQMTKKSGEEEDVSGEKKPQQTADEIKEALPDESHHVTRTPVKTKDTAKHTTKKIPIADLFSETAGPTISDKFKSEQKSLYEKIATEKTEKTLADTIKKPISDLRTGIGVNDRFLIINALFKGSQQDYFDAIDRINKQENLDEAMKIIHTYAMDFHWDEKSEGYQKLIGFVKRRFL